MLEIFADDNEGLIMRYCILATTIWVLAFSSYAKNPCHVTRAAIDVGSGTTKFAQAIVDKCNGRIVKIQKFEKKRVPHADSLAKNNNFFDEEVQKMGIKTLKEFLSKLDNGVPVVAIATSAFRTAINSDEYVEKIISETSLKFHVISQEQEAAFGLKAASSLAGGRPSDFLVWDIGGGSMQISSANSDGAQGPQLSTYLGHLASVPMKNLMTTQVQKKGSSNSPNPVSKKEYSVALGKVVDLAKRSVQKSIQKSVAQKKVLGIGGVIYYNTCSNIPGKKKGCSFTAGELERSIARKLGKSDEELGGGKFVDESVTNPILVLGFMKALGIEKMQTLKVSMANGVLIDELFWK